MRKAIRNSKTFWETVGSLIRFKARLGRSLSALRDSIDTSADDIGFGYVALQKLFESLQDEDLRLGRVAN